MIFDEFYRRFTDTQGELASPELESEARKLYDLIGDGEEFVHIHNPIQAVIRAYQLGKKFRDETTK